MPTHVLPLIPTLVALLGSAQPLPPEALQPQPSPGVAEAPAGSVLVPITDWPTFEAEAAVQPAEAAPAPPRAAPPKAKSRSAKAKTSKAAPRPSHMVAGPELPPDVAAALPFDHVLLASAPVPAAMTQPPQLIASAAIPVATTVDELPGPSVMPSTAAPVQMPAFPETTSAPMARLWGIFAIALAALMGLLVAPRTRRVLFGGLGEKLRASFPEGSDIQLAADKNLGMGQRVVALEIDGQKVLLGLSQGKMEVLHTWSPEPPPARSMDLDGYAQPVRAATRPHQIQPRQPGERADAPAVRRVTENGARMPSMRPQTTSGAAMPGRPQTTGATGLPARPQTTGGSAVDGARPRTQHGRLPGSAANDMPRRQTSAGSLSPSAERLLDVWRQASVPTPKAESPALGDPSPWWLDGATRADEQRIVPEERPARPAYGATGTDDIESELQDVLTLRRTASTRAVL